jgi:predicted MPP superfamily phosphohydrolase
LFTRRGFLKFLWRGGLVLAAMAAYPFTEVMARPRITTYKLTPPGWTPGLKLRAAVISDIHACEPWMSVDRIKGICDRANALEADVILLLGDYVSGMNLVTDYVHSSDWSKAMAGLKAPLGVHAVMGNHDYWEDLTFQRDQTAQPFAKAALEGVGIPVHVNQAVRLEKDGHGFWLAGLDDQVALRPGKRFDRTGWEGLDDLPATLAAVTDDAPVLLLAHEPDIFPSVPARVSLTISGHTHGGQVNIFGWKPIVPSRYGDRYAGGLVEEGGRSIVVSRGLGCSGIPVRFMSRPEIVVLELG